MHVSRVVAGRQMKMKNKVPIQSFNEGNTNNTQAGRATH